MTRQCIEQTQSDGRGGRLTVRPGRRLAMAAVVMAATWGGVGHAGEGAAFAVVAKQPVHGVIVVPNPQDVTALYYRSHPAGVDRQLTDWTASAVGLLLQSPPEAASGYWRAVYEDGRSIAIGERNLSGTSRRNLRDLGGYQTEDGRRIQPGLLFRSGRLDELKESERTLLNALGLRSLCDFRTAAEVAEKPNPVLQGVREVPGCSDQTSADITRQLEELLALPADEPVAWREVMAGSYRGMEQRYEEQFRAFFAGLMEEDSLPLLFRCTGGKDRTGMAAALLLLALGVPEETVLADYHLSELDAVGPFESEVFPQALLNQPALSAADPYYLASGLEAIRARHGSIENYLDRIGVDAKARELLRERLLVQEQAGE